MSCLTPPTVRGHSEKAASAAQEVGSHQTLNLLAPLSGLPASRTMRNYCLLFINHPTYGILLQQPHWTEKDVLSSPSTLRFPNHLHHTCLSRPGPCPVPRRIFPTPLQAPGSSSFKPIASMTHETHPHDRRTLGKHFSKCNLLS